MSIEVECSACGKAYVVKDGFAGKTAKCVQCGGRITIPPPSAPAAAPGRPATPTAAAVAPQPSAVRPPPVAAMPPSMPPGMPPMPEPQSPPGRGGDPTTEGQISRKKKRDFFGSKDGSVVEGAITLVLGILLGVWTQSHAPGNLATALLGGWVFRPAPYYGLIAVTALLAAHGVVNLARAVIKSR